VSESPNVVPSSDRFTALPGQLRQTRSGGLSWTPSAFPVESVLGPSAQTLHVVISHARLDRVRSARLERSIAKLEHDIADFSTPCGLWIVPFSQAPKEWTFVHVRAAIEVMRSLLPQEDDLNTDRDQCYVTVHIAHRGHAALQVSRTYGDFMAEIRLAPNATGVLGEWRRSYGGLMNTLAEVSRENARNHHQPPLPASPTLSDELSDLPPYALRGTLLRAYERLTGQARVTLVELAVSLAGRDISLAWLRNEQAQTASPKVVMFPRVMEVSND
jgi:hypothetical protein